MESTFKQQLFELHKSSVSIPSPDMVEKWIDGLIEILFPELSNTKYRNYRVFEHNFNNLKIDLCALLQQNFSCNAERAQIVEKAFFESLPKLYETLIEDATALLEGDPAAVNIKEVIHAYPGFFALAIHRVAHKFYTLNVPLIPRIQAEYAHRKTGIDIHPGAQIGKGFCIDHGTGIVIGETTVIGENVKIYQGVTLGALSVEKSMAQTKRHPTIEDNVVLYANATILGGKTVIGHDSVIGGSVWVIKSIAPYCHIYYEGFKEQKHISKQ